MTVMRERDSALERFPPAPYDAKGRSLTLWFGVFGGAAMWSVELLVNYGIAAHACYPRSLPLITPVIPWMRAIVWVVVILTAAVTGTAWIVSVMHWRSARDRLRTATPRQEDSRIAFMAFSGILLNALFLYLILLNGVPFLLMPSCSYGV